jgi:poly(3-hydroxyalkanoate) synthetase
MRCVGDDKTRERVRFATQQWVDALSPANFLVTNPKAQRALIDTQGKSLVAGMENMLADMQRGRDLPDRRGGLRGRSQRCDQRRCGGVPRTSSCS